MARWLNQLKPDAKFRVVRMAGRCADGFERGAGRVYHYVPVGSHTAICGAAPGRRSAGWVGDSENGQVSEAVSASCPVCVRRKEYFDAFINTVYKGA